MIKINDNLIDYNHFDVDWGQTISFPNTRTFKQYAHRIFNRYPARSISLVPRSIIRGSINGSRRKLRVLDPFMGSGTTAVETILAGCTPYGTEIDPLARLITEVRTQNYTKLSLDIIEKLFTKISSKWKKTQSNKDLYPQLRNIEYWFAPAQFEQLLQLKTCIYALTEDKQIERDFFRIVLADMIRPCSKAERQTLKPYISRKYIKTPSSVQQAFEKSFRSHFAAILELHTVLGESQHQPIIWIGENATDFKSNSKIDIAITSPPYTNALDYVRCIKLESAWIDCGNDESFSELHQCHVGDSCRITTHIDDAVQSVVDDTISSIRKADPTRAETVLAYFNDMYRNLVCTKKVLRSGGFYHLIIGDSFIRETPVPTHRYLAELGQRIGFEWSGYYMYSIRDHRTSIPRKGQGGKINTEYVVSLQKIE